jgi:enoyl-CoA hydratase/carnithine racemase
MSDPSVLLTINGPVATVTLNRPAKLNAIDREMLRLLDSYCGRLERDHDVRVVLFTGAGDRAFCVGADITEWSTLRALDMWRTWIPEGHRVFERVARLRQPTIAVLNGYTFGGGLELALAADLRVAAEGAALAFPECGIGTIPGWGGTQRLPALIGPARAKQMIFTGERISAVTAEQWGLVNEVDGASDESRTRDRRTRAAVGANGKAGDRWRCRGGRRRRPGGAGWSTGRHDRGWPGGCCRVPRTARGEV